MTEEQALDEDWDMIPTLTAYSKTQSFCNSLEDYRPQLERLISRHLGIPPSEFVLLGQEHWVWGSFNICLPIDIKSTLVTQCLPRQAILRMPLPFRCGEDYSPGNVEEKLRCEAATYIWLQRKCPSIPTPKLLAFTAIENETFWHKVLWQMQSCFAWLRGEQLARFYAHDREDGLSDSGYLLLEYVMNGDPLSSSWKEHRHDGGRCKNLFRSLSKILLDLMNVPLPRIGSWRMDGRGTISLTNRPLLDITMLWNRHRIPSGIPRDLTYVSADSFVQDLLAYQDLRLRHQPNSILGRPDGIFQLSALTALRALLPKFWTRSLRDGPFVLTLPDLHQSNIFVDEEWNIVGVIDFEFAPVQPQQMIGVPHWLSGKSIDELEGSALDEYKELHDEFITVLEEEEANRGQGHAFSDRLKEDWQTGRLWYNAALRSSNAFPLVFENNLQPRFFPTFNPDVEGIALSRLWGEDNEEFIAAKLRDKAKYDEHIRHLFAEAKAAHCGQR
ncbi:hypothetical protein D0863_12588 [Hortaea werneckii]|uniref:Aminoglycoside phosphotransferase domain-containing protein n=1 Tax=Hortaea werneckii TaxID=91943 RepID=A0A3M7CZZ7_HORWE|nr:hypothetical protein D0863_12588 [Hortaea werneckii]